MGLANSNLNFSRQCSHGPILPKNPQIADFLIGEALERRGVSADSGLGKIDDTLANKAREIALKLSR